MNRYILIAILGIISIYFKIIKEVKNDFDNIMILSWLLLIPYSLYRFYQTHKEKNK
jgi:hypothetical protein